MSTSFLFCPPVSGTRVANRRLRSLGLPRVYAPKQASDDRVLRTPVTCRFRLSPLPSIAYSLYLPYIFALSPAHRAGLAPQNSLQEALLLSLNFDYVLPLSFPSVAPVLHPSFESLFSFTVAYATLLVGFAADSPGHAQFSNSGDPKDQSGDVQEESNETGSPYTAAIAVLLVPFLTNISWLPYLATRESSSQSAEVKDRNGLSSTLLRVSQSALLPLYSVLVAAASVPYLLLARSNLFEPGFDARVGELARLVTDNILANSFAVDCLFFALFQAWLVRDDVSARGWTGARAERAVACARYVPFFGLAWYLYERAMDPKAKKF